MTVPDQRLTDQRLLAVNQGWQRAETRPGMTVTVDPHDRISLTSRHLLLDGVPWIPVSGEIHYSRVPRASWRERLLLMRSGGITVVSSYLIWLHHEPVQGEARFDGDLDVAAFVRLCGELGLAVVLRIGPWVHGEVRNGGFPDWVQAAPVEHRTDDPAYLDLVRPWFERLGTELAGLCGPSSPVIGIQLENELYGRPGHLSTLKAMAREAGLTAPLYTATAWGGAELPPGDVLPLYSGYGDGFWVDADAGWDDSFRQHFFFSHDWDDVGVGADVRGIAIGEVQARPRDESFPAATCELGGGMATTYHRRIVPTGETIAAVANAKVGSGSAWQGYYMYAGGLNPRGPEPVQESHATGYPNDLPVYDYDFHAAVGAAGQLSASHALLRQQHAFLAAFGDRLARMPSSLPEIVPTGVDDAATLRWALRADGDSGFVFLNWAQPHIPLPTLHNVRLAVRLASGTVELGSEPLDIVPGTIARWPVGLDIGGARLHWATGSVLTMLDSETLVLVADAGGDVEIAIGTEHDDGVTVYRVDGEAGGRLTIGEPDASVTIIVIGRLDAARVWVLEEEQRRLVLCADPLWTDGADLVVRASARPRVTEWWNDGWHDLAFTPVGSATRPASVTLVPLRAAGAPLAGYGTFDGRASAPGGQYVADFASVHRLVGLGEPASGCRRELRIDWAGDVAELLVDDVVVADRFWDGTPWEIDLDTIGGATGSSVTLRVLPLHRDSPVRVPADAEDRRRSTSGALHALDAVTLTRTTTWHHPL
ncbi:beta-galactosidase [Cryobacterium algoricola]|nr:beta-galactosidase [Cryobacterium algoricola]